MKKSVNRPEGQLRHPLQQLAQSAPIIGGGQFRQLDVPG